MAQESVIAGFAIGASDPAALTLVLIRSGHEDIVARFIPLVEYVGEEEAC